MSYNEELQSNNTELEEILQAVNELPAAGGGLPEGDFSDPDYVYAVTRPKDWLPMPTPGDDEVYLLNLIPYDLPGVFTAKIQHTGNCIVEFGNLVNGSFVVKESLIPTHNVYFHHALEWENYGDTTNDGYRQCLVRIKGDFTQAIVMPATNDAYIYGIPYLVDAVIGKTVDIRFSVSSNVVSVVAAQLRYIRFVGKGNIVASSANITRGCRNLMSISAEEENPVNNMAYFFDGCHALKVVSKNFLPINVDYSYAFYRSGIASIPSKHIQPTKVAAMFRDCTLLSFVDGNNIDTSLCADFTYFCYNAPVKSVTNLNISSAQNFSRSFDATHLSEITFAGDTTPGGYTINLASLFMSHKALVNMLNSLPTATETATITITGNPGAAELTDAEIAVATAKNWTVTI